MKEGVSSAVSPKPTQQEVCNSTSSLFAVRYHPQAHKRWRDPFRISACVGCPAMRKVIHALLAGGSARAAVGSGSVQALRRSRTASYLRHAWVCGGEVRYRC